MGEELPTFSSARQQTCHRAPPPVFEDKGFEALLLPLSDQQRFRGWDWHKQYMGYEKTELKKDLGIGQSHSNLIGGGVGDFLRHFVFDDRESSRLKHSFPALNQDPFSDGVSRGVKRRWRYQKGGAYGGHHSVRQLVLLVWFKYWDWRFADEGNFAQAKRGAEREASLDLPQLVPHPITALVCVQGRGMLMRGTPAPGARTCTLTPLNDADPPFHIFSAEGAAILGKVFRTTIWECQALKQYAFQPPPLGPGETYVEDKKNPEDSELEWKD